MAQHCPVCQLESEWLTTAQAGALAQVRASSIYRWLALGKAHGIRPPAAGTASAAAHSFTNDEGF